MRRGTRAAVTSQVIRLAVLYRSVARDTLDDSVACHPTVRDRERGDAVERGQVHERAVALEVVSEVAAIRASV